MSGMFQLLTPSRRMEVDTAKTDAKSAPHLLSVDLHQVLGKITTSQVQEEARLRPILESGTCVRHTVTIIHLITFVRSEA